MLNKIRFPFNSIAERFLASVLILVAVTAITVGVIQYHNYKRDQLNREEELLAFETHRASQYLRDVIDNAGRDVLLLADTPAVRGLVRSHNNDGVDALDGSKETDWKERLERLFVSVIKHNPDLLQVRFIGVENNGREIARVDGDKFPISPVFEGDLQEKGKSKYVVETLKAPKESVLFFGVDLNREHGKIEVPHKPVLRVTTPVYSNDGKIFGLLVINVHMKPVFEKMRRSFERGNLFLIANEKGDYLTHPDQSKTFGLDLGHEYRIQRDYGALASFLNDNTQTELSAILMGPSGEAVGHISKLQLAASDPKRFFVVAMLTPMDKLLAKSFDSRNQIIIVTVLLALLAAMFALFSARLIVSPLKRLSLAARELENGASAKDIDVPKRQAGEVGELAHSFMAMATALEERKSALEDRQAMLEEKKARIRAILEAAANAIITIDSKGIIQDANSATTRLLGYSRNEMIGANVSMLMPSSDADNHDQYLANYHRTKQAKIIGVGREVEARRKDGSMVPVSLAVGEVRLEGKSLYTGILTDLTQQRQLATHLQERQKSLEEAEASIRAILDTAASPIITINCRGQILDANPATTRLFGYSIDELKGRNISMLMTDENRKNHDQYLRNYQESKEAKIIGIGREVEALRSDGTTVPVHLAVSEVRLKDRTLFTGIITDLTEQKKIDKMKNEFVSTVSHELRTPLTSIKGSLGLLQSAVLGELPDQVKSMISIAYNNSDRLVRLINDILDMEKIKAGKMTFAFQRTQLMPFLERTIEANKAFADQFSVSIELDEVREDLYVESDPDRLAQVVTNLISNAAKFSPEGDCITIGVEPKDSVVRISVTDRGPGISPEFQKKIFSQFAQADSSDTRSQGGTGLGLSITKSIVEAHGGTIDFETSEGEGTTFYFDIPLATAIPLKIPSKNIGERGKILICEDDQDMASLIKLIAKDMGYATEVCPNAETAKARLNEENFAAMTLDISLPSQGGISLVRELRENPHTQSLPILVVSAHAEDAQEELKGNVFSVVDWLEKPVDLQRLREGIGRAAKAMKAERMRILCVDDDPDHGTVISSLVRGSDVIDLATSCEEARDLLLKNDYQLVILDLILPDGAGEDLLPLIQENGDTAPQVLVFSINDISEELTQQISTALVKSRTSNEVLRRHIQKLLAVSAESEFVEDESVELKSIA